MSYINIGIFTFFTFMIMGVALTVILMIVHMVSTRSMDWYYIKILLMMVAYIVSFSALFSGTTVAVLSAVQNPELLARISHANLVHRAPE